MFSRSKILIFLSASFVSAMLCLVYGFFIEPKTLAIRNITVTSANWNGPTVHIGLIADIHIGGMHVDAERAMRLTRAMNSLSPDIIILAGDYVDGHLPAAEHSQSFNDEVTNGIVNLGELAAPLGVYAAMGNHDGWYDSKLLTSMIKNSDISVLENAAIDIKKNAHAFCLLGLADSHTGKPVDPDFKLCQGSDDIIAFMHSPDSFGYAPADTDLLLAGHTHGGQINLPLIGRRVTATNMGKPFAYGLVKFRGIPAYITSGIGTSILPARFRSRPEIVLIKLQGTG